MWDLTGDEYLVFFLKPNKELHPLYPKPNEAKEAYHWENNLLVSWAIWILLEVLTSCTRPSPLIIRCQMRLDRMHQFTFYFVGLLPLLPTGKFKYWLFYRINYRMYSLVFPAEPSFLSYYNLCFYFPLPQMSKIDFNRNLPLLPSKIFWQYKPQKIPRNRNDTSK